MATIEEEELALAREVMGLSLEQAGTGMQAPVRSGGLLPEPYMEEPSSGGLLPSAYQERAIDPLAEASRVMRMAHIAPTLAMAVERMDTELASARKRITELEEANAQLTTTIERSRMLDNGDVNWQKTSGAIAFLRENWRRDGAEGESVWLLCDTVESLFRVLTSTREALQVSRNERECDLGTMCPCCASRALVKEIQPTEFSYGEPPVMLVAQLPVTTCKSCEESWAPSLRGEDDKAHNSAIVGHLEHIVRAQRLSLKESVTAFAQAMSVVECTVTAHTLFLLGRDADGMDAMYKAIDKVKELEHVKSWLDRREATSVPKKKD